MIDSDDEEELDEEDLLAGKKKFNHDFFKDLEHPEWLKPWKKPRGTFKKMDWTSV